MADNVDIANELMELRLAQVLQSWPEQVEIKGVVVAECDDCGELIPEQRRQAAPWATTCIECQDIREQQAKHRRNR